MKKAFAAMLCVCMLITLAACSEDIAPTTAQTEPTTSVVDTTPVETTPGDEGAVAVYDGNMIAVTLPTITESNYADDETLISVYSYPNISITLQDADIAEIITLDLLNRVDAAAASAQQIHDAAKQSYVSGQEFYPYYYDVQYHVTRLDQNILSLYCTEASFDGSPHSLQSMYSITYDLATGNTLSLRSILQNEYSADVLCDLIIEGLSGYQTDALFPDYETTIHDKFSTNVPVESWYFTSAGLCFFFEPYEIAPIALGNIVSVIPYEKLSGMMDEQFFPSEQPNYIGEATISNITGNIEASMKNYSQFAELTMETGVNQLLLTADGSISDLRIYDGDFRSDAAGNPTMIFAAAGIGPTDAILIEADVTELDGQLMIQYKSGEETKTLYLQVGESNQVTLIG